MKWLLRYVLPLVLSVSGIAQMRTLASRSQLEIGEQIEIIHEFVSSQKAKLNYVPWEKALLAQRSDSRSASKKDSISIEILEVYADSIFETNGNYVWQKRYRITIWDTGFIVLPPHPALVNAKLDEFPPLLLNVAFPQQEEGVELYDIQEAFADVSYDFGEQLKRYWWLLLLLPLLGGLLWFLRKRKKAEHLLNMSNEERFELAFKALLKQEWWKKQQQDRHFTELSYLFRSFLAEKTQLHLLEYTTAETLLLLKLKGLKINELVFVTELLELSDLVKFAGVELDNERIEVLHEKILAFIQQELKQHVG